MALRNILQNLAKDFGFDLNSSVDVSSLTDDVNTVVRDIHNSRDWPLRHSVRERLVNVGDAEQVVALPSHVGKVLAVRIPDTFDDIRLKGFEDRYLRQSWQPPFIEFRDKEMSAIKTEILTYGPLTLTFSAPLTVAVNVKVVGATNDADRVVEVVACAVGADSFQTTNSFKDIESIKKSVACNANLTITDLNDVELAVIPNHKLSSNYKLMQVLEPDYTLGQDRIVEVLFKLAWQPFVELDHTYYGTEDYDTGFYFLTKAFIMQRMGDFSAQDYAMAKREGLDSLAHVDAEAENGEKESYDAVNPLMSVQPVSYGGTNSRWGRFFSR